MSSGASSKLDARVVVIGGGVVGTSVLYWLTRLGCTDAVLLERTELTAGSTWHAAGNVTTFHSAYDVARLQAYSMDLYAELDRTTKGAVGFRRLGSLFLAHHEGQMDEYRMQLGRSRLLGFDYQLLSPAEASELHPLIDTRGLVGAMHDPGYGNVDPSGLTNAMAGEAQSAGAAVMRNTPVTGLSQRRDGSWDVQAPEKSFHAESVVNAAGFRAAAVAAMADVHLPIISMEHQYIVTDVVPELAALSKPPPALRGGDASYYMRPEGKGLLVGAWETDAQPWGVDGVAESFGAELLPPVLDRIESELRAAGERVPALAEAGIKQIINGPIAFGPDAKPHLGEHRGARNFYAAAGCTGGIAQAGGVGRCLAELIVEGTSSVDLTTLDADRFGAYATRDYIVAKVRECYVRRFNVAYPDEERPAGRPVKFSPLHTRLTDKGAMHGALRGWERPMWFAPRGTAPVDVPSFRRPNWFAHVGDECRHLRNAAGVLDLSSFAKYQVRGAGAEQWLNSVFAKPVPRKQGRIGLRLMLTCRAGVVGDLTVARISDDEFYMIGAAAAEHYHTRWLETLLPKAGVDFETVGPRYGVLALAGPRSREILQQTTNDDVSNESLPFFGALHVDVKGVRVLAMRVAFTGDLGYELHVPIEHLAHVYDALCAAGEAFQLRDFGMRAMGCLRLEKSYRRLGSDLTAETSPLEAGMQAFVDLDAPGFIGYEALCRQRDAGIMRTLVTLRVDAGNADAMGNEPVSCDGRVVGYVSSGGYGHSVDASIALAYVSTDVAEMGTALEIDILNESRAATVVADSLYDPHSLRLRA